MERRPTVERTLRGVLVLACTLGSGCASLAPKTTPGRATPLMVDLGAQRTALDLRQRADALVPVMMSSVELMADRVRAEATTPEIRRRALQFKIDLVPVVFEAGFRPDPVAAGMDLWLLSYQIAGCVEAGAGICDFGPQQATARTAAEQQRAALDRLFEEVSLSRTALATERQLVLDAARRHPLRDQESLRQRTAITTELEQAFKVTPKDPFELIADVSTTLRSLSSRLNLYIEEATRLGRWQAELLAEDISGWPTVERTLGDVNRATASVERLSGTLDPDFMNGLVDRTIEAIGRERVAAIGDVDRQRELTLQYLTSQREALVNDAITGLTAALDAQRVAATADLRRERIEMLAAVDQLRGRLLADGFVEGRQLVDYFIWRLAALLAAAMVLAAVLAWLVKRLGSRPGIA
jgi:hypothetical protein